MNLTSRRRSFATLVQTYLGNEFAVERQKWDQVGVRFR